LGVLLVVLYLLRQKPDARLKQIPIIRYSDYLPDLFNRFIFYPKAKSMIYGGYEKVL
jgi:cytochrome P450 monooxygenase